MTALYHVHVGIQPSSAAFEKGLSRQIVNSKRITLWMLLVRNCLVNVPSVKVFGICTDAHPCVQKFVLDPILKDDYNTGDKNGPFEAHIVKGRRAVANLVRLHATSSPFPASYKICDALL